MIRSLAGIARSAERLKILDLGAAARGDRLPVVYRQITLGSTADTPMAVTFIYSAPLYLTHISLADREAHLSTNNCRLLAVIRDELPTLRGSSNPIRRNHGIN